MITLTDLRYLSTEQVVLIIAFTILLGIPASAWWAGLWRKWRGK